MVRLNLNITGHESDHNEYYVPYAKIAENSKYRLINRESGTVESRELVREEDVFLEGEKVGSVAFTVLITKTKLYVEQMDCVIFS